MGHAEETTDQAAGENWATPPRNVAPRRGCLGEHQRKWDRAASINVRTSSGQCSRVGDTAEEHCRSTHHSTTARNWAIERARAQEDPSECGKQIQQSATVQNTQRASQRNPSQPPPRSIRKQPARAPPAHRTTLAGMTRRRHPASPKQMLDPCPVPLSESGPTGEHVSRVMCRSRVHGPRTVLVSW